MPRTLIQLALLHIVSCSALAHRPTPTDSSPAAEEQTAEDQTRARYRQLVCIYQRIVTALENPMLTPTHRAILRHGARDIAREARAIERAKKEVSGRRQKKNV